MSFDGLLDMAIKNIGGIIGFSILIALIGILAKVNWLLSSKFMIKLKNLNYSFKSKHADIGTTIECDKLINHELSRLLVTSNASRVGLFQFQNGNKFANNNPIWKVTSTHEQCEIGVTEEVMNIQSIPSSQLATLVSSLFTGLDTDGVTSILLLTSTSEYELKRDISIFRIDPDDIKSNYIKNLLIGRGTKFAIMAPLLDWNDDIVGFTLLEYCHDGFLTGDQLKEYSELSYKSSSRIFQIICSIMYKKVDCKKCSGK